MKIRILLLTCLISTNCFGMWASGWGYVEPKYPKWSGNSYQQENNNKDIENKLKKQQEDIDKKLQDMVTRLDSIESITTKINSLYKILVDELSKPNPCKKEIDDLKKRIDALEKEKRKRQNNDL